MEESVFFPSPNWYLTSVLEATTDGWLIYGSPAKGICVLSPVESPSDITAGQSFKVRTIHNAHKERVLDVSVSPSWPSSRLFVTSSEDGFVKQWNADDLSLLLAHNVHSTNKEPVAGLTYCNDNTVVSAGREGTIVVWDVQVNVTKNLTVLLKGLKPNCLSSSPHDPTIVAIGTKQGVVIVCSINDGGRMLYKVRGHDSEILKVCWCPCPISYIEKANNKRLESSKSKQKEEVIDLKREKQSVDKRNEKQACEGNVFSVADRLKIASVEDFTEIPKGANDTAEGSDDSSESIVQEEDLFDVYKDPVDQEFGHTKFKSEEIVVADGKAEVESDFLEECKLLKQDLLSRKDERKSTNKEVEKLSNQLKSTQLSTESAETQSGNQDDTKLSENWRSGEEFEPGIKQYKNMLASCCKSGKVCVWSMGKQVAFASPPGHAPAGHSARRNKLAWCAMHWLSADTLLLSDAMNRLLEFNTNKVGRNNQFSWQVLHEEHRRGLFCISSDAPRVQSTDENQKSRTIWSLAQDRFLVSYVYPEKRILAKYPTFGGFVYHMTSSPNDPSKFAICVGDGSLKIWEMELDSSNKLVVGGVTQHWQNIQGKVLYAAWHPTKENLLAYGTMEGRIGLLDTSGKQERAARLLYPAMAKGVYSLSWGERDQLYACGGHQLYLYNTKQPNAEPELVSVKYDNKEWKVTVVCWSSRFLTVGNADGDVALLTSAAPHRLQAAAFPLRKAIQCICWHPGGVSSADEASPHSTWLAVSCADTDFALLNVVENPADGEISLELVRTFVGHSDNVIKLAWSPHHEARLLSVAMDGVAQVWDAESGRVTSSFLCHTAGVLAGAWWPDVGHGHVVMTAGADYSLRMWDTAAHPPSPLPLLTKTQKKRAKIAKPHTKNDALLAKSNGTLDSNVQNKNHKKCMDELDSDTELPDKMATAKGESKVSKKYIMAITSKQQNKSPADGCRLLLQRYMMRHNLAEEEGAGPVEEGGANLAEGRDTAEGEHPVEGRATVAEGERVDLVNGGRGETNMTQDLIFDVDYLKLFGTKEDVLELIQMEQERHLSTMCLDGWLALTLLVGETESALRLAAARHTLTPFLLSLAPAVSHRFWKEMMALYVIQIEKTEDLGQNPVVFSLGGAAVRAALVQLSLGNADVGVARLARAGLWREASTVARVRGLPHADVLAQWAAECAGRGQLLGAALIYIALEDFNNAITVLRKNKDPTHTDLAVKIAKLTGQHIYAQTLQQTVKKQQ